MIVYEPYNFGGRLKSVLNERHISPTHFAKMMGIGPGTIFRMFKLKNVDTERMKRVSVALQHDFVVEFGATSPQYKKGSGLLVEEQLKETEKDLLALKEKVAEQVQIIERMNLEAKYLRELVEAYKKK